MNQPQSFESEQQIIGAIMKDPNATDEVVATINSSDFYHPKHKIIYDSMTELYNKTEPLDLITVSEQLKKNKRLEDIGGRVYLAQLTEYAVSTINVKYHCKIVKDKSVLRQLITIGDRLRLRAAETDAVPEDLINKSSDLIFKLSESSTSNDIQHISEAIAEAMSYLEGIDSGQIKLMKTGFSGIDKIFLGFEKTSLTVVGGYTGQGKSRLVLQIAEYLARNKHNVHINSHEMSNSQLATVLLTEQSLVDTTVAYSQSNRLKDTDWDKLTHAQSRLSKLGLFFNDIPTMKPIELLSMLRQQIRKHNIEVAIVDYLQLMTGDKGENRTQEVSNISRGLKAIGMELDVAMIAVSQLTKPENKIKPKKPTQHDLKESSGIAQDADNILFPYHDDNGNSMVIIAKQRRGKTGEVPMSWNDNIGLWRSMEFNERNY